jgi:hypothetical protein
MLDKPNKDNIPKQAEEMDEIDKFLATLPALNIPEDMLEDESKIRPSRGAAKVPFTSILVLLSWFFFLISLLVAAFSLPSRGNAFHTVFGATHHSEFDPQYLAIAMWFLFAVIFLCVVGLLISVVKKRKMTGGALNFWIAGGLSAVLAVVFMALS